MKPEKTQTVRINQGLAKGIKIYVAKHGGTIKSLLEDGATYMMKRKLKKKANEFYETQQK